MLDNLPKKRNMLNGKPDFDPAKITMAPEEKKV